MFSTKAMSVITLLSILLMVGVVVLQYMEFAYYGEMPSLWP